MKLTGSKEFLAQFDSSETRRAYKREILTFFRFIKKDIKEITRLDFMAYIDHLKKTVSSSTISRSFYALKSFFKFMYSIDQVTAPAEKLFGSMKLPNIVKKQEEDLSDDEVKRIISKTRSSLERLVIKLMLYNGLRRSEVCKIKFGDIQRSGLDTGEKTTEKITLTIVGKGGKSRTIPIHGAVWDELKRYLKDSKKIGPQASDKSIITINGHALKGHDVYLIVVECKQRAGIERCIHPHMFRAKFCSMALESGVPITSVQADLGHSSIQTTSMYDHAKHKYERSSVTKIKEIDEKIKPEGENVKKKRGRDDKKSYTDLQIDRS